MKKFGRVALEALLVTAIGVGLAFAANRKSAARLELSKNYFPRVPTTAPTTSTAPAKRTPKQLVEDDHFIPIEYEDVLRAFQDKPGYESGVNVIIDARGEDHYKEGHIPLAWRIDRLKVAETVMADPLKLYLLSCEKVIVYCEGGECEDSRFLAGDLRNCPELLQAGFNPGKIHIYYKGMSDWVAHKQPVEKDERGSGQITTGGAQ